MCLIQYHYLILKQIRIIYTLTYKYPISNISKSCFSICIIIKSYCIPHLFPHFTFPFCWYSIRHAHCGHSPRLCNYNIDVFNGRLFPCSIFLNLILAINDRLLNQFRVHHILRKLSRFSWSCVSSYYTEIAFNYFLLYFIFILKDW